MPNPRYFNVGKAAYCQMEIRVNEAGTPPWHIGIAVRSLAAAHARQRKT
jgi:hypothetical protein